MSDPIPLYRESHALIIGINTYHHAPPLGYARHDAEAVATLLTRTLDFPTANVEVLLDSAATAAAIRGAIARLSERAVSDDDRCCIFFAGHGHTRMGRRGEVGFLVPCDGDPRDIASLIRWSELTNLSDLIRARHVLFLMDACYGGLALTRTTVAGSMRFLRDMLKRPARQVLTAGKADELVADSGGPRPNHSVFTGHLLDALEGAAATSDGVLTANGAMAYVYDRVARDPDSRQTPHYGHFDGDGDMVFKAPPLDAVPEDPLKELDVLVDVPASTLPPTPSARGDMLAELKECLSDSRHTIKLDDLITAEIRRVLTRLEPSRFPLDVSTLDAPTLAARVSEYDAALGALPEIVALLGRWGREEHGAALSRIFERLADVNVTAGGYDVWLALRWMPVDRLYYYAGLGCLSRDNYAMMRAMYKARSIDRTSGTPYDLALSRTVGGIFSAHLINMLKQLPGHERQFVPRSELYFKEVQPRLEDLLFLGASYEDLFDRFEVLHALVYVDTKPAGSSAWGPAGRFGWKQARDGHGGPLGRLVAEAKAAGNQWAPLRAGLFSGSIERFSEAADAFARVLSNMNFF